MATPPPAPAPAPTTTTTDKPIHSLVLDTGPLIKNDPTVSALLARAEQLYILPSVVSEIRDVATRARLETQLLPFVTVRAPRPKSVAVIREFARKTGDLGSLSKPDLEVLALGYDLECERNDGDWRLRSEPDQKQVNGKPPQREAAEAEAAACAEVPVEAMEKLDVADVTKAEDATKTEDTPKPEDTIKNEDATEAEDTIKTEDASKADTVTQAGDAANTESAANTGDATNTNDLVIDEIVEDEDEDDDENGEASDDDGGWITPSNIKKHRAQGPGSAPSAAPARTLQAAILTSDYAMQNVALRMNLNLVTPSFSRITHLKTWVLRCHGCFKVTKQTERQFCPSCGQPTLLRTSCSTDAQGRFRLHLKRGFQWNNRGNVYSVPKPVHGTPHGRLAKHAGGQNNWGVGLMLAEDQKEYVRAAEAQRKQKKRDLMDEEFLPGILTGDRAAGGKIKVGAGRTVNGRRRR